MYPTPVKQTECYWTMRHADRSRWVRMGYQRYCSRPSEFWFPLVAGASISIGEPFCSRAMSSLAVILGYASCLTAASLSRIRVGAAFLWVLGHFFSLEGADSCGRSCERAQTQIGGIIDTSLFHRPHRSPQPRYGVSSW